MKVPSEIIKILDPNAPTREASLVTAHREHAELRATNPAACDPTRANPTISEGARNAPPGTGRVLKRRVRQKTHESFLDTSSPSSTSLRHSCNKPAVSTSTDTHIQMSPNAGTHDLAGESVENDELQQTDAVVGLSIVTLAVTAAAAKAIASKPMNHDKDTNHPGEGPSLATLGPSESSTDTLHGAKDSENTLCKHTRKEAKNT